MQVIQTRYADQEYQHTQAFWLSRGNLLSHELDIGEFDAKKDFVPEKDQFVCSAVVGIGGTFWRLPGGAQATDACLHCIPMGNGEGGSRQPCGAFA